MKGVGEGFVGVITCSVNAVLRTGHGISSGISGTANKIKTGKVYLNGRIRYPRYIGPKKMIEIYDWELSSIKLMLRNTDEKMFRGEKIVNFFDLNPN